MKTRPNPSDCIPLIRGIQSSTNSDACYEKLLTMFNPMICDIVYKKAKYPRSIQPDDLMQEARIALFNAAGSFVESNGATFSTYVYRCMANAVFTFIALNQGVVSVPERDIRKMQPLRSFASQFHHEAGCYPEMNDYLKNGFDKQDAQMFMDYIAATCMSSGLDCEEAYNCVAEADEPSPDYQQLYDAINQLTEQQQRVIRAAFFENKTMREIADEMDIRENVAYEHQRNALEYLRQIMNHEHKLSELKVLAGVEYADDDDVLEAIRKLPSQQQKIISALYIECKRPRYVSNELSIPSYTVSKCASTAMKTIKQVIDKHE